MMKLIVFQVACDYSFFLELLYVTICVVLTYLVSHKQKDTQTHTQKQNGILQSIYDRFFV